MIYRRKNETRAFTLAEVLITLGIIGIVAAITVPTLIAKYEENQKITRFFKFYSELTQAYMISAQENGTADNWMSATEIRNNIAPYLKLTKNCNTTCPRDIVLKTLNEKAFGGYSTFYHVVTTSGVFITFVYDNDNTFIIDINGEKKPNRLGIDVFTLKASVKKESPFIAWPTYNPTNGGWVQTNGNSMSCRPNSTNTGWWDGGGCVYWLLKHKNMDYIHKVISNSEWQE